MCVRSVKETGRNCIAGEKVSGRCLSAVKILMLMVPVHVVIFVTTLISVAVQRHLLLTLLCKLYMAR